MDAEYTIPCNTADGIDHGKGRIEFCLNAMIERYEDGYVLCPILWTGGSCHPYSQNLNARWKNLCMVRTWEILKMGVYDG